jgi:hypothetical protein
MQKRRNSLRLSLLMLRGRKRFPTTAIGSNSEPWIQNARSLAYGEAISNSVERSTEGWERGTSMDHGVRLMEAIDLIVTKQLADRPHDETDIRFLTIRRSNQ